LHLDDQGAWTAWLEAAGAGELEALHGPVLNRASMLIDAAVDGHGIALARTTLAAWDLIHKRLIRPFPIALPLAKSYWIVCPKATAKLPKLIAFRDWLLAQARDDLRQLRNEDASFRAPRAAESPDAAPRISPSRSRRPPR
jgi:LysR family glycine cleavage system transcriptional activator